MALVGKVLYADGRYPYAAAAAYDPGDVIVRPDGTLAVLDGFESTESGERINPEPIRCTKILEVAAASADTWAAGTVLFWNASAEQVTATRGSNKSVGVAVAAKTSGQTSVLVNAIPDADAGNGVINIRTRFTIAQINAGATIVPAEAGIKYRMIDCSAIAVGGAAAAVTTVDVLATQSASGVKLVAFGQAALTQNTLLRAGASGATILAGGVSFVANEVNTALTIGKTGSDVTTATHVDINLTYDREVA
jgi:predicted RecA/RadA family phage recombinase